MCQPLCLLFAGSVTLQGLLALMNGELGELVVAVVALQYLVSSSTDACLPARPTDASS